MNTMIPSLVAELILTKFAYIPEFRDHAELGFHDLEHPWIAALSLTYNEKKEAVTIRCNGLAKLSRNGGESSSDFADRIVALVDEMKNN